MAITYAVYISYPDGSVRSQYAFGPGNTSGPSLSWSRSANNYGMARIEFWGGIAAQVTKLPFVYLRADNLVEIWRSFDTLPFVRVFSGFLRDWTFNLNDDGTKTIVLKVAEKNYLLTSRINAYANGTAQAKISGAADDLMKELVRDNLGVDAAAGRNLTSVGNGFSVQANRSLAPTVSAEVAWRDNLLDVLQELGSASREGGTKLFFEIANIGLAKFEFRTFTDRIGRQITQKYSGGGFFSTNRGNVIRASLYYEYLNETNYVYAGGQGEGSDKNVVEVSDTTRIGRSIWNRREAFVPAGGTNDTDEITALANHRLRLGRPFLTFEAEVKETELSRYGYEWRFGDEVSVTFEDRIFDGLVNYVQVDYLEGVERMAIRIEFDDALV